MPALRALKEEYFNAITAMFEKPATGSITQNTSASELFALKKKCTELNLLPPLSDLMIKQIPLRQMQCDNKYNGLEYLIAIQCSVSSKQTWKTKTSKSYNFLWHCN